eukprot:6011998-Prymnesium_polylepis.2
MSSCSRSAGWWRNPSNAPGTCPLQQCTTGGADAGSTRQARGGTHQARRMPAGAPAPARNKRVKGYDCRAYTGAKSGQGLGQGRGGGRKEYSQRT